MRPLLHRYLPARAAFFAALAVAVALPLSTAHSLELLGGSGINTTAPGTSFNGQTFDQPLPWNNVGVVNDASGIYLGDIGGNGEFWVLAPYHVTLGSAPATVSFGGNTYNTIGSSYVRINNTDSSAGDMVLFQLNISANPSGLTTLTLATTTPVVGTDLYYMGYGGGTKQWGYNQVAGYDYGSDGYGNVAAFSSHYYTSYNPSYPASLSLSTNNNEAQGVLGDSGGGAFVYNSITGTWELAGMLFAVDTTHTPISTFSEDIASYEPAILAAIPEPGATWGFLAGAAFLFFVKMKRRKAPGVYKIPGV